MSTHTFRRYLRANGLAHLRFKRAHYPLRVKLYQRLRECLESPVPHRSRSAPPGAFRTAWGWHRIAKR